MSLHESARDRFLQEPTRHFQTRMERAKGKDRMEFLIDDGIAQMMSGIREIASEVERNIGSTPERVNGVTIFQISRGDAVGLTYLAFLKELRNAAQDGKFETQSVLSQIDNARTGTLATSLEFDGSDGAILLSESEQGQLQEELRKDPALLGYMTPLNFGGPSFKLVKEFCQKYGIGQDFDRFGRSLQEKIQRDLGSSQSAFLPRTKVPDLPSEFTDPPEVDGHPGLLKEGEPQALKGRIRELKDLGLDYLEIKKLRGFSVEEITVLLGLVNKVGE